MARQLSSYLPVILGGLFALLVIGGISVGLYFILKKKGGSGRTTVPFWCDKDNFKCVNNSPRKGAKKYNSKEECEASDCQQGMRYYGACSDGQGDEGSGTSKECKKNTTYAKNYPRASLMCRDAKGDYFCDGEDSVGNAKSAAGNFNKSIKPGQTCSTPGVKQLCTRKATLVSSDQPTFYHVAV